MTAMTIMQSFTHIIDQSVYLQHTYEVIFNISIYNEKQGAMHFQN